MTYLQKITNIAILALASTTVGLHAQSSTPVATGVFHGQVHSTSGPIVCAARSGDPVDGA